MPQLRRSVKGARQKYFLYLDEKKMATVQNEKSLKQKKVVQNEISEDIKKKVMLEITIKVLEKDAGKYVINAEKVG